MQPILVPQSQAVNPADVFRPNDNPNRMSVEEYDALKNYIRRRGFLQPVVLTESRNLPQFQTDLPYIVVDGDHRVRIGSELSMPLISAIVVDASEAERIRDRIAMNKHRGQLDVSAVGRDLERLLKEFEFDADAIADTGFSNEETLELLDALKPPSAEDVLRDSMAAPPEEFDEDKPKKWGMSLSFDSEADRARVKAMLLEFADGGSLATGMMRMVDAVDDAKDA